MPRTNKPMTLSDLGGGGSGGGGRTVGRDKGVDGAGAGGLLPSTAAIDDHTAAAMASGSSGGSKGGGGLHKTCHIPTLPSADTAKTLLERVVREFRFIAEERGYNVLSVSELCCCNDGLDFEGRNTRKLNKCSDNVLGYNRTMGTTSNGGRSISSNKVHTIHLRLRHVRDHSRLYDYEDVAGTLAHELAHCEHAPHNEAFFKLMDQFLEEHAVRMASGITSGGVKASMPSFSGSGQTLGGGGSKRSNGRSRLLLPGGLASDNAGSGHKLGGDNAFTQWMTPSEAAAVAAIARRRQEKVRQRIRENGGSGNDGSCCGGGSSGGGGWGSGIRSFVPEDILKQAPAPASSNNNNDRKRSVAAAAKSGEAAVQRRADENQSPNNKRKNHQSSSNRRQRQGNSTKSTAFPSNKNTGGEIIDLTLSSDDDDDRKMPAIARTTAMHHKEWSCRQCTFLNPRSASVCNMCAAPMVL